MNESDKICAFEQPLKSCKDLTSDWNAEEGVVRLSIRRVYPEDEGEYSCIVHNDSVRFSTSACLVVDGEPLVRQLPRDGGLM